jgi:hypothetical protein
MNADYVRKAMAVVRGAPFPTLGDPAKVYPVELTEPEINAIHAGAAFIRAVCADWPDELAARYWKHYGPTLQGLSERLAVFDDCETANERTTLPNQQSASIQTPKGDS